MNNIEIIDNIQIDFNKFKTNSIDEKMYEASKNSYIKLCKLIHENNHKLLSSYTGSHKYITIDTGCEHGPVKVIANQYKTKTKQNRVICPTCEIKTKGLKYKK